MTDVFVPPPEQDLPPARAAEIRDAVLRSAAGTARRPRRPGVWLVAGVAAALAVLLVGVLVGVRPDRAPTVTGTPSPAPATATAVLPPGSVETDAGPLGEAGARAVVAGLDRPPGRRPAALVAIVVARRLTTELGGGTFVVWTTADGSTWYVAEIPGTMKASGPITGPAATEPPRPPDGEHPVTRLEDLGMFGWTMDADRPDATARDLHAEHLYLTTTDVSRVEVRMTVEGRPGPWFSAPVHEGFAFVPAVTTGPHSTTEDVDEVTTIEDRALDANGAELPIRAR